MREHESAIGTLLFRPRLSHRMRQPGQALPIASRLFGCCTACDGTSGGWP